MNAPDPLAQMDDLQLKLRAAYDAEGQHTAQLNRLSTDLEFVEAELREAHRALAVNEDGAEKAVDQAENKRDKIVAVQARTHDSLQGAREARVRTEEEIKQLRRRELAAFAEEADTQTEAAMRQFGELEEHYRRAQAMWDRARQAWAPLTDAIRDHIKQIEEEQGIYRPAASLNAAAQTPPWPLLEADPGGVFERAAGGTLAVRPPGVDVAEGE